MKTSELIAVLAKRLADHGDQEVFVAIFGRSDVDGRCDPVREVSDEPSLALFVRGPK